MQGMATNDQEMTYRLKRVFLGYPFFLYEQRVPCRFDMGTKTGHYKPGDFHVIPFLKSQYPGSITIKNVIPIN